MRTHAHLMHIQTLSTLRYAAVARMIKTDPKKGEDNMQTMVGYVYTCEPRVPQRAGLCGVGVSVCAGGGVDVWMCSFVVRCDALGRGAV